MSDSTLGTPAQLRDPNYTPPLAQAIPLGIQHVLAMFASNVTPAIIVAGFAGFGFGSNSPDFGNMIYMIQMAMLFAGIATLFQTIGMGPVGARLPIVQGTSFAFLPIMIPAVAGAGVAGMAGLMTGVVIGGLFHMVLGTFIGKIRYALPPLVTGLIVLMIGLALVKVGIQYAAGGVPAMQALNKAMAAKGDLSGFEFGSLWNWSIALVVIVVTLAIKFFTRGFWSVAAILVGLVAGYVYALIGGDAHFARAFGNIGNASWFNLPSPFKFGFEWNWAIIIGMCLMAIISAIETVGDTSGITKGGAGREATDDEVTGATYADGLGTAIAGIFGGLPNTSFSQNVGLISMTGIMSRGVVTIGAIFLIICGLIPKVGAIISTVPIEVLGGGVIVMFGMVAAAGVNMLSGVNWNRRNMLIFATALSIGLGLQLVPDALVHMGSTWKILLTSGLLPAAFIAIVLNLLLPDDVEGDGEHETQLSGLGNSDGTAVAGATVSAAGSVAVASASGGAAALLGSGAANDAASSRSQAEAVRSGSAGSTAKAAAKPATRRTSKPKTARKSSTASATKTAAAKTSKPSGSVGKGKAKSAGSAARKAPARKAPARKAGVAKARTQATKAKSTVAKAKSPVAKSAKRPRAAAAKSTFVDDVALIDGIGPVISKGLKKHDLGSLTKMAAASLPAITKAADDLRYAEKSAKIARDWQKQAKDLVAGKPARAKSDRARQKSARK